MTANVLEMAPKASLLILLVLNQPGSEGKVYEKKSPSPAFPLLPASFDSLRRVPADRTGPFPGQPEKLPLGPASVCSLVRAARNRLRGNFNGVRFQPRPHHHASLNPLPDLLTNRLGSQTGQCQSLSSQSQEIL